MHRILLVEDSKSSQVIVRAALAAPEFQITVCETLAHALELFTGADVFDLILLDLSLPDGEGMTLLRRVQVQPARERVPVLLLTGKEDLESKVAAFAMGAEDYLVKPIDPVELRARVELRLRKAREAGPAGEALRLGDLTIDFTRMQATVRAADGETVIDFTAKEFKIVATLARNLNRIFSRQQLVEAIWGHGMHVVDRTVDSHICGARRKMGTAGRYIQSVTGEGYRFAVS